MVVLACRRLLLAAPLLLLAGCGGGIKTGNVSGVVTLDGKPLANAIVKFTPKKEDKDQIEAPGSSGQTDASGKYTLQVVSTGDDGAMVGTHSVSVMKIPPETEGEDSDVAVEEEPLPKHEFTFEVKSGDNTADFDIKS